MPTRKVDNAAWLASSNFGSHVLIFDDEVVQLLRAAVEREGSQLAYARRHGLERAQVNQILAVKRPVSASVVKALGLQKVYTAKLPKP